MFLVFFFQAEDGIRDGHVTGVQTCALPISLPQVPMIPTGGVNLDTAADFIRAGAEALGIGGELVSASALKSGNTAEIADAARRYVAIVQAARQPELAAAK